MRYLARFAAVPFLAVCALAQDQGAQPAIPDPEILQISSDVSADRIQRAIYVLSSFRTRHSLSDPQPSGDGIGAAEAWVENQFDRISRDTHGRLQVESQTFTQRAQPPLIPQPADLTNVVATLPGTDGAAGAVYVVAAHLDSRGDNPLDAVGPAPGADDDASGVAALLEIARAMSVHDYRSTLVFLALAGGEQYGNGAAHWADQARARGLSVAGVVDLDGIGNSHGVGGRIDRSTVRLFAEGASPSGPSDEAGRLRLAAGGENDSPSRELARAFLSGAQRYGTSLHVRLIYRAVRDPAGDEPRPFLDRGLPTVRLTEALDRFRPRAADIPDSVDFGYAANVARMAAAAVADLARAPAAPAPASVGPGPNFGAIVRWAASPGASGYRVVWRETTSPNWEHSVDEPPSDSSAGISASPENAIFGVVAVDAAGHESPAAYALPVSSP
jgi:hypothetical protein